MPPNIRPNISQSSPSTSKRPGRRFLRGAGRATAGAGRYVQDRYAIGQYDDRSLWQRIKDRIRGGKNVISGPISFILTILIIAVVVGGGGFFLYNAWRTGALGDLFERGETGVENVGLARGVATVWDEGVGILFDPTKLQRQYSIESDVYETEDSELLGIRVSKPEYTGGVKRAGNLVRAFVTIEGRTPKNTNIKVLCRGENGLTGGEFELGLQEIEEKLYAASETVACEYIPPRSSEKKIDTMTTYATAQYEFENEASLRIYVVGQDVQEELGRENPLLKDNIVELDPQLKQTGSGTFTTKSQADAGPVNLGIGSTDSQPFAEERNVRMLSGEVAPYIAFVELSKQSGWNGGIREIKDVKVYMPEIFRLVEEKSDFTPTGGFGDNGFAEYSLKPEILAELGKLCKPESIKESDCHKKMEDAASFEIDFMVEPPGNSGLYFTYIRAKSDYIFETVGDKATATIQNEEAIV